VKGLVCSKSQPNVSDSIAASEHHNSVSNGGTKLLNLSDPSGQAAQKAVPLPV